jgi:hypothetical protein
MIRTLALIERIKSNFKKIDNMKTIKKIAILLFVFSIPSFNICSQNIFSFSGKAININNDYIDALIGDDDFDNAPFVDNGTHSWASPDSVHNYTIDFFRYKGWNNTPGDSHVFTIYSNGTPILTSQNRDAWIKVPSEFRKYTNNDYFISVNLSDNAQALLFTGYTYGRAPHLSIVVVKENQAKLVFNKDYFIQTIEKTNATFSMLLRMSCGSWLAEAKTETAIDPYVGETYRIWLENGVLRFAML